MKAIELKSKEKNAMKENDQIDLNQYFDPTPPPNQLNEKKQKEFDDLMALKFGENHQAKKEKEDIDFDEIEILRG